MVATYRLGGIILKGFSKENLQGLNGEAKEYIHYLSRFIQKPFVKGCKPLELSLLSTKAVKDRAGQVVFPAQTQLRVDQMIDTFGGYGLTKDAAEITVPELKTTIREVVKAAKDGIARGEFGT